MPPHSHPHPTSLAGSNPRPTNPPVSCSSRPIFLVLCDFFYSCVFSTSKVNSDLRIRPAVHGEEDKKKETSDSATTEKPRKALARAATAQPKKKHDQDKKEDPASKSDKHYFHKSDVDKDKKDNKQENKPLVENPADKLIYDDKIVEKHVWKSHAFSGGSGKISPKPPTPVSSSPPPKTNLLPLVSGSYPPLLLHIRAFQGQSSAAHHSAVFFFLRNELQNRTSFHLLFNFFLTLVFRMVIQLKDLVHYQMILLELTEEQVQKVVKK